MVCVTPALAAWWEVRDRTERAAAEQGHRSLHKLITSVLSTGLWNCLLFLQSFLSTRFTHRSGTFDAVSCHAGGPVSFSVGFVNSGFITYFEAGFSVLETILSSWWIELFGSMKWPSFSLTVFSPGFSLCLVAVAPHHCVFGQHRRFPFSSLCVFWG